MAGINAVRVGIEPGAERLSPSTRAPDSGDGDVFGEALLRAEAAVRTPQEQAAGAIDAFTQGASGSIHDTLMAVEKADISMKFLVTVRNRVIEAYREVMRMGA